MGLLNKIFGDNTALEEAKEDQQESSNGVSYLDDMSQQTPDEQKLAHYIKTKTEESRTHSSRISHEGIWMTNTAYLLGFDGVFYDTSTRTFRSSAKGNQSIRRNRVHVNKILPSAQNRLARLCKNPPRYDVLPNTSDEEDKQAARVGIQVINMVWRKQEVDKKRINLYMSMQQHGHSYVKVSWDPTLGEQILDPDTNELLYEGDIRLDVCSAFELFPDPLAKTLDECAWLIQAKVRKLDYFKTHYPERGHIVKEEGAWLLSAQYESRINTLNNLGQGQTGAQNIVKNCAIELSYYEPRSDKYPNGRLCVAGNGVLLANKELPVGEVPFAKFDDTLVGGKYYSESIVTHTRPLQDQYNRNIALRSTWLNKLLAGKYLAAKGHGLAQEAFNDQSGEVVEYDPVPGATEPKPLTPPTIPSYAYQEDDRVKGDFYDIYGINEVSRGVLPAAGIPAIGMQFLMEQDDTRIGITTESNEYSWARVGKLVLMYASKFYKSERMLKSSGKNLQYAITSFIGSDLRDNHDVTVIRGSTLPGSKVLKRQELLNIFSQGLLGSPQDPEVQEKVLGALEFGDVAEAWADIAVDRAQIEQQIKQIEQEIIPFFDQGQNHKLHLIFKNRYKKSSQWDKLSQLSKQILDQDMQKRIQFLMHLANPQINTMKMAAAHSIHDAQQQIQNTPPGQPVAGPATPMPNAAPGGQ